LKIAAILDASTQLEYIFLPKCKTRYASPDLFVGEKWDTLFYFQLSRYLRCLDTMLLGL